MLNSYPYYSKSNIPYMQNSYVDRNNMFSFYHGHNAKSHQKNTHPNTRPYQIFNCHNMSSRQNITPLKEKDSKKNIQHDASKKQKNIKVTDIFSFDDEKPMFELFGIKLYQDDILLICLIFFLYNEGIKDEFLFIALILLLLS